ncbi:N/A [soil metagenome]
MNHIKEKLENHFEKNRKQLLSYIYSKVNDYELAEDILQECLLKALQAAPDLRSEEKLIPWFRQIVRNAIIDYYRQKGTERTSIENVSLSNEDVDPEEEEAICACFEDLISTMNPEYAQLIKTMELGEERSDVMAEQLGITRNHLKVKRYRARKQLRQRLEETCQACATQGCLDCTC